MKSSQERKSVFRILIIRIFLSLLLFNILFGAYIISDEINKENRLKETRAREISFEIDNMLSYINHNITNLEKNYSSKQKRIYNELCEQLNLQVEKSLNINQMLDKLNYDTTLHIVSVIRNDKIIISNMPEEIGKNVFNTLTTNDSVYFRDIEMSGIEFPTSFFYSRKFDQFRIISLKPAKQNLYIIAVNSASPEFNIIVDMLKKRLLEMVIEVKSIKSVNFWFYVDNQRIPLVTDSLNQLVVENITPQIINTDSVIVKISHQGKDYWIKHQYEKSNKKIYNIDGISVSVVMDYSDHYKLVYQILQSRIILLLFSLTVFFLIIYFATKGLKLTIFDMLIKTSKIGKGDLTERVKVVGNDEFTTLAEHFNDMVEKVETAHIQLKEKNEEILAQKDEIEAQHNFAIKQKEIIEKQKTNILDSIEYAQRIQEAVLPEISHFKELLPESFVFFRPRDIVSGDFFWVEKVDDEVILVAADCTGHGVPGAFMSMLGVGLLNEIIVRERITQPNLILNELRKKIKYALKQTGKDDEAQDGMEMTICTINNKKRKLQFAAAMNPLILIRNNELTEFKADLMPVGVYLKDTETFTYYEMAIEENDTFYMFSDGYADQMGGPKGRKFMSVNFKALLSEINNYPIDKQMELLEQSFIDWKKDYRQIDDVLVLGFKVY